jgi:nucleoside 2-deoxyribosyltransferase
MYVYVAAQYERKAEAEEVAQALEGLGHKVTSTWHRIEEGSWDQASEEERLEAIGRKDLWELDRAGAVVVLTKERKDRDTPGHHFEVGYGFARGKAVVVVGPRSSCFYFLDEVKQYDTVGAMVEAVRFDWRRLRE